MFKWESVRLGDVVNVNMSSYSAKENLYFVNYLDTGNITNGVIDEIQYINLMTDKLPSRAKRRVKYNSILFSTVRPNQRHFGIVKSMPENFLVSTGFAVIDVLEDKVDADYLYFYLSQDSVIERLHAIAEQSVSAYPSIKPSDIENLHIELPPLVVQKSISSVLKSITDKISINTEINDNLLQQAQAIFKSWFVEFEPHNGVIPSDWRISTLAETTEMSAGGDKPKILSMTKSRECPYPVYSNGLLDEGLYGYTNIPKIKDESVTVSARGTIGFICLRHIPYVPIVRLITLIPNTALISAKYLYLYLKQLHISGTGTTQQQLTVPDFKKTEILIPSKDMMDRFSTIVTPMFNSIWYHQEQNEKLIALRDSLLPKLISGELDVSEI